MTEPSPRQRSPRSLGSYRTIVRTAGLAVALQAAVLSPTSAQALTQGAPSPPDAFLGWLMSTDFPDLSQWPGVLVDLPNSCVMIAPSRD